MQGFHDRNDLDRQIEETEKYIEMFRVIKEGYEIKLNRLKKEKENDTTRR